MNGNGRKKKDASYLCNTSSPFLLLLGVIVSVIAALAMTLAARALTTLVLTRSLAT